MPSESDLSDGVDVSKDDETAFSAPPHSPIAEHGNDKCLGQHKESSQNVQMVDAEKANEGLEISLGSYSEEKGADTFNEPRNFDLSITAPMFRELSSTANLPPFKSWFCKVLDFYQHYDFFILLVAVILLAFAYPPLGAVYLLPQITASWIAVMYSFCTYHSSAAGMKS